MQSPVQFLNIPDWSLFTHFVQVQAARFYDTEMLNWQWKALFACLLLCLNPWIIPKGWLILARRWFHVYAQNRSRAVLTCALFPVLIRVALLPAFPLKPPSVHDEFSLLLMADTFSSGRLTVPTHPLWRHFETIHVIQKPTYGSMYPPGFGAFMALGQLLYHPWLGVLLTVGLMCGALCWMLQAWLPAGWALGGALIAALQIGIASYWMNSYVGGAPVPAMAGALLLGAIPRFLKSPHWYTALLFALGVVILVNTRPFEGVALSVLSFVLALYFYKKRVFGRPSLRWQVFLPAILLLVAGGGFTAYYSWRVTGSPLKTAYVVNRETYGWPENLAILPPLKLEYRHKILADMEWLEISRRSRYSTLGRIIDSWSARASILWEFYIGTALTPPFILLFWVIRSPKMRILFYLGLALLSLNSLQLMAYPQHVSAETAIIYLLIAGGLRQLYVILHRRRLLPERAMLAIVLCSVCAGVFTLGMDRFHIRQSSFWEWPHWPALQARATILSKLNGMPGKHLVIVHYEGNHSAHEEWVYNSADIDNSKIVWANAMGVAADKELLAYFPERNVWLVEPDHDATSLLPLTRKTYYTAVP